MGRARVKASTCDVGHRWAGCRRGLSSARQARPRRGRGLGANCWPAGVVDAGVKSALRRPAAALDPGSAAAPVDGAPVGSPAKKWALCRAFGLNGEANTCTIVGVLEELGTAIETLDIPLDGATLTAAIALRDRLDARISDTIAAY